MSFSLSFTKQHTEQEGISALQQGLATIEKLSSTIENTKIAHSSYGRLEDSIAHCHQVLANMFNHKTSSTTPNRLVL
jgi:hypothetical protein